MLYKHIASEPLFQQPLDRDLRPVLKFKPFLLRIMITEKRTRDRNPNRNNLLFFHPFQNGSYLLLDPFKTFFRRLILREFIPG